MRNNQRVSLTFPNASFSIFEESSFSHLIKCGYYVFFYELFFIDLFYMKF